MSSSCTALQGCMHPCAPPWCAGDHPPGGEQSTLPPWRDLSTCTAHPSSLAGDGPARRQRSVHSPVNPAQGRAQRNGCMAGGQLHGCCALRGDRGSQVRGQQGGRVCSCCVAGGLQVAENVCGMHSERSAYPVDSQCVQEVGCAPPPPLAPTCTAAAHRWSSLGALAQTGCAIPRVLVLIKASSACQGLSSRPRRPLSPRACSLLCRSEQKAIARLWQSARCEHWS